MQRQPEPEYMDLPEEADAYAQADFSQVNEAFVSRLLEITGQHSQATALDIGTGPADIPIRLAARQPGWHLTALDASPAMLDLAARAVADAGLGERIELMLGDAKKLPLPSQRFDVVFSNSILHHVHDAHAFWTELKRVAAPGATVFLRDLARPVDPPAARQIVETYAGSESVLLQEEYYRSLLAAYTVEEVQEQLRCAGLGTLKVAMVTDRHFDVSGTIM